MNVNFGLFPPLADPSLRGRERKAAVAARALADLHHWLSASAAAA